MSKLKIIVFCELTRENYPVEVSFQITSKAASLTENIQNAEVQVLIIGKRMDYYAIIDDFSKCGADKVIIVNDDVLEEYSVDLYRKAIVEIAKQENPDIILFGATVTGRELAPVTATALETGLTADCTDINITDDGKLEVTRPTYGGKMLANILCKTLPQMATIRPNIFKAEKKYSKDTKVDFNWIDTSNEKIRTKLLEIIPNYSYDNCNLSKAEIIFAGGKGLKNKENFKKLYELAKLSGGYVGASRGAVDAGFAPSDIQIGQTGQTVNAKIYVAFGISGMVQHLEGINSCDKIIAVNNDKNAPIFKIADVCIVGDANEIISEMIKQIQ